MGEEGQQTPFIGAQGKCSVAELPKPGGRAPSLQAAVSLQLWGYGQGAGRPRAGALHADAGLGLDARRPHSRGPDNVEAAEASVGCVPPCP